MPTVKLDPQPGEVWQFRRPTNRWKIVENNPTKAEIIIADLQAKGEPTSPYLKSAFHSQDWQLVKEAPKPCPRCEENDQLEDDYLCRKCRYGV